MNKKELWLRLKNYHFDHIVPANLWDNILEAFGGADASTKAFAAKIAKKHNWSNTFALRAIDEYKKFVYLGVVSNFHVTPSKDIDVVWHEHLLFSKAYREFCSTVIEYTFDHHPELIPMADETGRFSAQYIDTLDLYKTEFGVNPPEVIWSNTKFDKEKVAANGYESREKKKSNDSSGGDYYSNDTPLYSYFDGEGTNAETYPEFSEYGGGEFGGAGAGGEWSDSDSTDSGGDGGGCSGGCGGGD
jgi:uncharacterized membrane protein YgcG